ncbi:MAG: hypothetical protein IPO07_15870 [Haliscomenobacter sp.]|nr:hypothetical protein [Haliscomenobacter sp.]MBK9490078.1 hypothetical protein [Haliscomenobacter sp.]
MSKRSINVTKISIVDEVYSPPLKGKTTTCEALAFGVRQQPDGWNTLSDLVPILIALIG